MLDHKTTLGLIAQAQKGDEQAKASLIEHNSPLVKSVIRRYKNSRVDYEDLYQLGCLGFLKAIRNFNPAFEVRFSTYAVPMIAGEVKRFLRDDGSIKVSRALKSLNIKINRFVEECRSKDGTSPSIKQIADNFEMDENDIVFAMDSGQALISLDQKQDDKSPNSRTILEGIEGEDKTERMLDLFILKDVIKSLEERDKKIIILRYFRDKTQSQIAKELGISQVQVSRLEGKILERMRVNFRVN